jgi:hypothetical protein
MNGSSSGQVIGTPGTQTSMEQSALKRISADTENAVHSQYLKEILPGSSPLKVPSDARITEQQKDGYKQVKYQWSRGDYNYTSRWHTRTPGAPLSQGDSWVVERHKPGIGSGPNARKATREILIGKDKWVSKAEWDKAVRARKNGTATQAQKEMLDHGHWKA